METGKPEFEGHHSPVTAAFGFRFEWPCRGLALTGLCLLPLVGADPSHAGGQPLRNYSIEASVAIDRQYTQTYETSNERRFDSDQFHYRHEIYVSEQGRIFYRRRTWSSKWEGMTDAWVQNGSGEALSWLPGNTIRQIHYSGGNIAGSTYIEVTLIKWTMGQDLSCTVEQKNILRPGSDKFVSHSDRGTIQTFSSLKPRQDYCKIWKGNVFKVE